MDERNLMYAAAEKVIVNSQFEKISSIFGSAVKNKISVIFSPTLFRI